VSLNITAIGLIAGFYFAQHADPRILFVIPIISPIFGMMYIDHAANIANIGRFIQHEVMPELARAAGVDRLPDYEIFVREFEKRGSFRFFVFGTPILFIFAILPLAALVLPFLPGMHTSRHPSLWAPAGLDGLLLVAFAVAWRGMMTRGDAGRLSRRLPGAERS
jgi:hypothetical protein